MLYTDFESKVLELKYNERKHSEEQFTELDNVSKSLWKKFIRHYLFHNNSLRETQYVINKFFDKQEAKELINEVANEIKSNPADKLNLNILLNNDLINYEEKRDLINNNNFNMRQWRTFFYNLSYNGSKMLPDINKKHNFKLYQNDKYFNNAFFSIYNKFRFVSEEDKINEKELDYIALNRIITTVYFDLIKLGLNPTTKLVADKYSDKKLSPIEEIMKDKKISLIKKLLSTNEKSKQKFYLRDEAASFVYFQRNAGINKDILHKLIINTKNPYLSKRNEYTGLYNTQMIIQGIIYSGSYHEKNIELLLNTLSPEEIKESLSEDKSNIKKSLLNYIKDDIISSEKCKNKINLVIALKEKELIQKAMEDNCNVVIKQTRRL